MHYHHSHHHYNPSNAMMTQLYSSQLRVHRLHVFLPVNQNEINEGIDLVVIQFLVWETWIFSRLIFFSIGKIFLVWTCILWSLYKIHKLSFLMQCFLLSTTSESKIVPLTLVELSHVLTSLKYVSEFLGGKSTFCPQISAEHAASKYPI